MDSLNSNIFISITADFYNCTKVFLDGTVIDSGNK